MKKMLLLVGILAAMTFATEICKLESFKSIGRYVRDQSYICFYTCPSGFNFAIQMNQCQPFYYK